MDEYTRDNPEFLVVFSAGNSGVDADRDGVVDKGSVLPPSTAKNCLTVGATENERPDGSTPAPAFNAAYGWFWPEDYPAAPLSSDHVSNHPEGMAAFSSRGSSFSGRYKPEISAPGTNVISARSHAIDLSQPVLWGPGGLSSTLRQWYTFSGGTSMSAPLVSGAAALARQFYGVTFGAVPSSALLRATLLSWARDITPGQYGTGLAREIPPAPRPNNVCGWGRLDLSSCRGAAELEDFYYFEVSPGLSPGGMDSHGFTASPSLKNLCVTLAWNDYPGSAPAGGGLVNDLDLEVVDPLGTVHYPGRASWEEGLIYDDGEGEETGTAFSGVIEAVRFTPPAYPAQVTLGAFYLASQSGTYPKQVKFRIYSGNSSGPHSVLAETSAWLNAPGWLVLDLENRNLTIASGDFFLGVLVEDEDLSWNVDLGSPSGRNWEFVGGRWFKFDYFNRLFRAQVRLPSLRDRSNNVETVEIELPAPGYYQARVRGHNVPHGPQPYALVATRPAWSGSDFPARLVLESGDYNGDGTSDIAVFRWFDGLWAVRGLSRFYFGKAGDLAASGDYDGSGTTRAAVFRPATGFWAVRGLSRFYFGGPGMVSAPADYDGDGRAEAAVFRESDGLWKIRGLSSFYFGRLGDQPVPGLYEGDPAPGARPAVFRPGSGLWALRGFSRFWLGKAGDVGVPMDYDGVPGLDLAIFRPGNGFWSMYGYTRFYFGALGDAAAPGDFDGDSTAEFTVFRSEKGLWAARGRTRVYFGQVGDIPATR